MKEKEESERGERARQDKLPVSAWKSQRAERDVCTHAHIYMETMRELSDV
jgi:hypothetical protein